MRLPGGRFFAYIGAAALGVALLNTGTSFLALKKLEKKAGTPIQGILIPHFLSPSFTLKNPRINWQNRFEVISAGNLEARYDPLFLLGRKFRVQVKGSDLAVRLEGALAESQGLSEAHVDEVTADFALPRKGDPEIFSFQLHSPELQFQLAEKKSA
ncbi:MAG: hypothetical protein HY447_04465 [Candidatus Omnitrophica bacterium]|nr:hypothetical protein [Candidatus Omnitrophota bacterium]